MCALLRLVLLAVTTAATVSCAGCADRETRSATPLGLEPATELAKLQGRWRRGESGCSINIDGPHFQETCASDDALLYGAKSYVISFPQLGQIRLSEGGSYHNYGYARNGDDIYLGEGGAGQVFGELFVAAPLHQRVLLVMKAGECRAHAVLDAEHPEQGFESQGIVIDCDVSRSKSGFVVRFDAVVAAASRNTERLEFSQVGDAVISPAVRLGRLLPCLGACSVSQSAP